MRKQSQHPFKIKALQSSACLTTSPGLDNEQTGRKAEFSALEPVLRVINTDKNAAYPKAIADLKAAGILPECVELRHVKYLNNLIKQDHRFVKRLTKPGMGFFSFETAWRTLQGYEAMNMIRKGQLPGVAKGVVRSQIALISELFGVAA
jgi:IS6 family transposase